MTRPEEPFVLLDDARPGGSALLFRSPFEVIESRDPEGIGAALASLEQIGGSHAAGYLAYEAGHGLEPRLARLGRRPAEDAPPLLWFGIFAEPELVDAASLLPDPAGAWAGTPVPLISRGAYEAALSEVKAHIAAGNIYQANLTFQAEVRTAGHPLALYAGLRRRARAGHGAVVFTGRHWILSLSPELFFTLEGGRVTTRPMKGTAPAGSDPAALRDDPKQRAENLMIVDLLRNDLSRIARTGSVEVPALFAVETYPTVLQMTSTVVAELDDGLGPIDLLRAIYPCGSITGAPKIRAMEIIAEIELEPRGVYCGAIGAIAPGGDANFNVAIRTLTLKEGEKVARLGLGSGIVADSQAGDEWRECLAKGRFVASEAGFDLIETMKFDPHVGIANLDRHLERMKRSAEALDFAFDRHEARNELQAATFRAGLSKVRLLLSRSGAMAIELRPLEPAPAEPVEVAIADSPVFPDDFRIAHKTTDRGFYDEPRDSSGTFEIIFRDRKGLLTEGSFTNIFLERDGLLITPPLSRGLLPGLLRQSLIDEGKAIEADLTEADLANGFFIGNTLRGLLPARLTSRSR
jgi:para-aminobenzoate synthetase / 4-amino-4-deoxychorismate lyase